MASSFYGEESVRQLRDLFLETGKLLTTATLVLNNGSSTNVSYSNVYLYPETEVTAMGQGGTTNATTTIVVFQIGESTAPRPDDYWSISGVSYQILNVQTSHNADANYARHDCGVIRAS